MTFAPATPYPHGHRFPAGGLSQSGHSHYAIDLIAIMVNQQHFAKRSTGSFESAFAGVT